MSTELEKAKAYAKKLHDAMTPEEKARIAEIVKDPNWHIRAAWGDMADAVIEQRKKAKK